MTSATNEAEEMRRIIDASTMFMDLDRPIHRETEDVPSDDDAPGPYTDGFISFGPSGPHGGFNPPRRMVFRVRYDEREIATVSEGMS